MSTTIVTVRTPTGSETDLEIPAEIPAAEVVRLVVAGLRCAPSDLVLYAPELGRRLNDNETLAGAEVLYGYHLELQSRASTPTEATAEGPARAWRALDGAGGAAPPAAASEAPPAKPGGYSFKRVD